jgi:restriction endonuclease S subunit
VRVIQLKDFENYYTSLGNECFKIDGFKIKEKYYLKHKDILFISKGTNNFALTFKPHDDVPTIASSALFVIRVDEKKAVSEYVAWYVNQSKAQRYLKWNETGTYVPSISKSTVEQMPIALPSLEKQRRIAQIAQLNTKEQKLHSKIKELKNNLVQNQLLNTVLNDN